jgi:hypothetical protein
VLGNIKSQARYNTLHSIAKINKGIGEYKSPSPVKFYIQLGRSTKVLRNKKAQPVKIYIQLGKSLVLVLLLMMMMMVRMMMIWNEPAQVPMLAVQI